MRVQYWMVFTGLLGSFFSEAQVKRQFSVENNDCKFVRLCLKANSANCFIKPSHNSDILNVFSNQDVESFSHQLQKEMVDKVCEVTLSLEAKDTDGFGETISNRMFGPPDVAGKGKFWKMYLTENKPYVLELNYGVGNANVDLSGLSINRLKINTGSADVNVGYLSLENAVDMDTFYVKADVGSVQVDNLNLSRSHYVVADVGVCNMTLDFGGKPLVSNTVKGSVGAGNLIILLPDSDVPVLVKVQDSWLCSVKMPSTLKRISSNTFANEAYQSSSKNLLTFNLDVSMGKIVFKEGN